ncbi:MAG: MarR family transcriptional regulator [Candidatus Aenigmatarchaeota archaeon]
MKNRIAGFIILGIAALIGFIIFSFNRALVNIVNTTCTHGSSCPMWGAIDFQTNISIGIMIFVVIIALYLIFFGKEKMIVTKIKTIKPQFELKKITKENYQKILNRLTEDEKLVLEKIIEEDGTIFQSELVDKTNFTKVKITRILDKLEGKGLVERKRRGMTNVVILKQTGKL